MQKMDIYIKWCTKCSCEYVLETLHPCRECLGKTDYFSYDRPLNFDPSLRFDAWCPKCMNNYNNDSYQCTQCYADSDDSYYSRPAKFVRANTFDICCPKCQSKSVGYATWPCSDCELDAGDDTPTHYREDLNNGY